MHRMLVIFNQISMNFNKILMIFNETLMIFNMNSKKSYFSITKEVHIFLMNFLDL